jgi:cyanophycin synthetase
VKGLVAEVARQAVVLNAQDERCVAMAARLRSGCEVVYFAMDVHHPVFADTCSAAGAACMHTKGC